MGDPCPAAETIVDALELHRRRAPAVPAFDPPHDRLLGFCAPNTVGPRCAVCVILGSAGIGLPGARRKDQYQGHADAPDPPVTMST
jgi:hypothetical protein